jgi:hypothetical protein
MFLTTCGASEMPIVFLDDVANKLFHTPFLKMATTATGNGNSNGDSNDNATGQTLTQATTPLWGRPFGEQLARHAWEAYRKDRRSRRAAMTPLQRMLDDLPAPCARCAEAYKKRGLSGTSKFVWR